MAILTAHAWAGVTITSPLPGETWTAGQEVSIFWTKTPDVPDFGFVGITLRRPGGGPGVRVTFSSILGPPVFLPGDGVATFVVPDWTGNETNYVLTLVLASSFGGEVFDDSVSPISVVGSKNVERIELRHPAAGVRWRAGHRQRVDFTATGYDGPVSVSIAREDGSWSLNTTARAADGFAVFDLPNDMPEGSYIVGATALRTPERQFRRIHPFDDAPAPAIDGLNPEYVELEIIAPDPTQVWNAGEVGDICWTSSLTEGDVFVSVSRLSAPTTSGASARALVSDGCVSLTPCPYEGGDDFVISVTVRPDSGEIIRKQAPDIYTILATSTAPTLNLTSLNDAPIFATGDLVNYTWDHSGFGEDARVVAFLVVEDDEHIWLKNVVISEPIANGSASWTAYPPLTGTTEYVARVCVFTTGCPPVCDVADAPLTILPPANPPVFDVPFDGLESAYAADEIVDIEYFASGVAGMEVELRVLQNDSFGPFVARQPAVDGIGNVIEYLPAPFVQTRMNRFEVRLLDNDAVLAKVFSDPFAYVSGSGTCGDIAHDMVVDHQDWFEMAACMALWGLRPGDGPQIHSGCRAANLHGGEFIDLRDWQVFQNLFGVGSTAEAPNCPIEP